MGYIGIYWDILKIFTIESYVNPSNLFVMSQSWNKWVESEFCRRNFAHLQASGPEHLHISREDFRDASQKNRKNKKKRDEKGIPEHLQDITMTPMTCFPIFRDIWSISHIFPTFFPHFSHWQCVAPVLGSVWRRPWRRPRRCGVEGKTSGTGGV